MVLNYILNTIISKESKRNEVCNVLSNTEFSDRQHKKVTRQ